ncbi:MAG: hypothetical protein NTY55_02565 [Flavobacteriia bacterium]|nr:hypothetical protein [Flavobacteriia bacterium]
MAKVRIRKAGPGETAGYYNKTAMFLNKAQMGQEVQSEEPQGQSQEEMVQAYYQYAEQQLSNEVTPDKVYTDLVSNGLPEKVAYQIITSLMDKLVDEGVINPDYKREKEDPNQQEDQAVEEEEQPVAVEQQQEDQSMFEEDQDALDAEEDYLQDRSYMQDGGYTQDDYDAQNNMMDQYNQVKDNTVEPFNFQELISKTPGIQPGLNFPSLAEYIPDYQNVQWNNMDALQSEQTDEESEPQLESQRVGGMVKKKQFVKNVMSLLKKQEGGDNAEQEDPTLGKGNPMDTLTEDVQKHKNNFLSAIKTKATTVKTEEMYDKLRKSNDPDMQQLAMQSQEQQFQVGGMTGGQDPLFRFLGGGDQGFQEDPNYYEADFLPEAKYGYSTGNLRRAEEGEEVKADAIPKAKVNYVPRYNSTPGTWGRSLTPWNPIMQSSNRDVPISRPYNYGTNTEYTGPFAGLTPVARQVTKRGIFGRPKRYTDIYAMQEAEANGEITADGNTLIFPERNSRGHVDLPLLDNPHGKKIKHNYEDFDDLSMKAKMAIRRGERFMNRNTRRLDRDPDFKDVEYGYGGALDSYMPKAQGGMTINNPNLPQPAPALTELSLANQPGLIGQVKQGPNTVWGQQESFSQPGPVNKEAAAYNSNNPSYVTEPLGNDLSECTEEQKKDPTSKCYNAGQKTYVGVDVRNDRSKTVDPEAGVNLLNAGVRGITGLLNRKDEKRRERQMYDNMTSDNLYASQAGTMRGQWNDLGSMAGMLNPGDTGQDTSGYSSYGKYGGYMQDGGESDYDEGDEVYMTDDDIKNFMANGGEIEYI